jgi:hypothetical protein
MALIGNDGRGAQRTMIQVGTLDDASWVKPAMQIYCDSAQPWVQLAGDMARFPKMPPSR